MTEILSWQAKLAENKTGLILAKKKNVLYSLPQSQGVYLPANNFDHKSHPLRIATGSWIHKDVFLIQPICWQSSTSGTIIHHNGDPKFSAKIMYIKNHIPVILVN